jgi:hypothetical protein
MRQKARRENSIVQIETLTPAPILALFALQICAFFQQFSDSDPDASLLKTRLPGG